MTTYVISSLKALVREQGVPFELKRAPYTDPESLEALRESIELENDPNAKTFRNVNELFAECLEGDDD